MFINEIDPSSKDVVVKNIAANMDQVDNGPGKNIAANMDQVDSSARENIAEDMDQVAGTNIVSDTGSADPFSPAKKMDHSSDVQLPQDTLSTATLPAAVDSNARSTVLSAEKEASFYRRDVNCCADDIQCRSVYPIDLIQKRNANGSCPKRYLVFAPYAQFNNIVRSFVSALWFAAFLGRTVVVSEQVLGLDLSRFFNFSQICVEVWPVERFQKEYKRDRTVRGIGWDKEWSDTTRLPGMNDTMKMEWIQMDPRLFDELETIGHPSFRCILQSFPAFPHDSLLYITRTFYTAIDSKSYRSALSLLPYHDSIRNLGDKIIDTLLAGKPFIGIHLRYLDGTCEFNIKKIYGRKERLKEFQDEALESCGPKWDSIKKRLARVGIDPSTTPIFLADDGQRGDVTEQIVQNGKVKRLSDSPIAVDEYLQKGSLEAYILTKSVAFIGISVSSFSFHIALRRELNGFSRSSNLLPGYPETGFLLHFLGDKVEEP
jgi:hypothetical protein